MHVRLHPHAASRMAERGATEAEVVATVSEGERFPGKYGRTGFRRNFPFAAEWRGRRYGTKQLEVYAVDEDRWLVIILIVRHFRGRGRTAGMQLSYDPRHNVAYLRFHVKTTQVETIRISEELNVDLAPDGTIYGIEWLNANEQLRAGDQGLLVLINEAAGERQAISLT